MHHTTDTELIGLVFGRLTVTAVEKHRSPHRRRIVRCICNCGNSKSLLLNHLRTGATRSCGCLLREKSRERMRSIQPLGRGGSRRHGQSGEPEYHVWRSMKARCVNPNTSNFRHYGQRGIKVCKRWLSFDAFFADMGKRPSAKHQLERINNNGNYSKQNCRWATCSEQARNRRSTRFITFNGERLPATVWADRLGLNRGAIAQRLNTGWTLRDAVTTPRRSRRFRVDIAHVVRQKTS